MFTMGMGNHCDNVCTLYCIRNVFSMLSYVISLHYKYVLLMHT